VLGNAYPSFLDNVRPIFLDNAYPIFARHDKDKTTIPFKHFQTFSISITKKDQCTKSNF